MGDREFLKKTPSIVRQLSLRVMFFVIHCPLKSVSSCSRWRLLILMFWGWATLNGHWYWILGLKKADIKTKRFAISTPGVFTVKWDGHSYPLQERRGTAVETDSCEYCTDWNDWKYAKKYYRLGWPRHIWHILTFDALPWWHPSPVEMYSIKHFVYIHVDKHVVSSIWSTFLLGLEFQEFHQISSPKVWTWVGLQPWLLLMAFR